jgi:transketolase
MAATAPIHVAGLRRLATRIRLNATRMVAIQRLGYLCQAMSSAEIFAVLYGSVMRPGYDRFILSPGHYTICVYAAAAETGRIDAAKLATYGKDGSELEAIGTERTPVVDLVNGSLGQGLSGAVGFALAARFANEDRHTFAFLSDGELEEGQVWEAAMFAGHHRLDGLTVVIDANNSQVDGPVTSVSTLEPLADKWRAFGWRVIELDGHDLNALVAAFKSRSDGAKPLVIVARTIITGGLRAFPPSTDTHFVKLDKALETAIVKELEAALA